MNAGQPARTPSPTNPLGDRPPTPCVLGDTSSSHWLRCCSGCSSCARSVSHCAASWQRSAGRCSRPPAPSPSSSPLPSPSSPQPSHVERQCAVLCSVRPACFARGESAALWTRRARDLVLWGRDRRPLAVPPTAESRATDAKWALWRWEPTSGVWRGMWRVAVSGRADGVGFFSLLAWFFFSSFFFFFLSLFVALWAGASISRRSSWWWVMGLFCCASFFSFFSFLSFCSAFCFKWLVGIFFYLFFY